MTGGNPANGGRTTLYRWNIEDRKRPVRVLDTIDALFGCQLAARRLICAHEGPTRPRTLVSLDPLSGALATLFDPNPDFAARRVGPSRRLVWTRSGVTTYGDLVLPPDHRPGERDPLVIVQYTSRGFLRGGTGDEVPIQLLAAHGFAVLSFQRPAMLVAAARARDLAGVQRVNIAGLAERRMIFAALNAGVDAAVATGAVDPARIGITGLSDGAVTTQFALLHSRRFKAAAIGSCCDDPSGMIVAGLSYRDALLSWRYPRAGSAAGAFWEPYSLAANAGRMKSPLLIQVSDGEYRLALETYSALQLHRAPVEMYVYPDEHHVKWHPAHRLAGYERYVAWFDFWLRDKLPSEPRALAEARRWQRMRIKLEP
jgi:dipeptidyl aminopeptidase/acylaminoacyl peptidase